tara:strand:+ start:71 stop:994 length:924 start_codon:yes stop_codon:yes gene_type:complete
MGLTELAAKAGRSTEKATFTRLQKRYPGSDRSSIRSFKIAKIKGERKVQALSKRLDIANPRSIQIQHKKGKEWTFSRPLIEKGSLGGKKLRRFETYVNKKPKNFSQKPMKKNFLQDDDPNRALKSMRLDKEGSHMRGNVTEGRSIGTSLDPVNINYNTYKKSQLVKMAKGEVGKSQIIKPLKIRSDAVVKNTKPRSSFNFTQKPFTNSQKVKVMEAGNKGLKTFIDREVPVGSGKLYGVHHVVKTGKTYSKRFGQFRLPSNTGRSPSTIIPEFTEKTKIIGNKTKKVTATGTYKWRKGKKNKMYVIE